MIAQPTDVEVGAGTFNQHTFLRALGPEPWRVAYDSRGKIKPEHREHYLMRVDAVAKYWGVK